MKAKNFPKVLLAVMMLCVLSLSVLTMSACAKKPSAVAQTTLAYDGSVFTWDSAKNAKSYKLVLNGNEYTTNETRYTFPASQSASTTEIEIYAVNGKNVSEKTSKTFTRLKTIDQSEITFTPEGVMSWPAVDNASKYTISVNGTELTVDTLEFSEFQYGVQNNIKIKPIGFNNSFYSFYSVSISKTYLTTPESIAYDGQYLTWRGHRETTEYLIYINGTEEGTAGNRTSYEYNANEQSFYVTIKAIGDGRNYFNSKMSEEKDFRYLGAVENLDIIDGKLTWDPIEQADGYEVDINGTKTTINTNSFDVPSGSEVNAKVKPLASQGTVYYSAYSRNFKFFIMNAPQIRWNSGLQLDGDPANAVYWDPVAGAVADYRVKLVTPDGLTQTNPTGGILSFNESFIRTGTYYVSVQTVAGGGTGYYDSVFSNVIEVRRLPAPNVDSNSITSNPKDVNEGFTVKYSTVFGATAYRLYKDGTNTNLTSNTTSMDVVGVIDANTTAYQEISYSIQSVGSVKNVGNTVAVTLDSLSSGNESNSGRFSITVLAAPKNLNIDGDRLYWDTIENVPGYVVDLGTRFEIDTEFYSLASIVREGNYDVKVCTRGNGKSILPSNYTAEIKINKLPAPTNIKIGTTVNEGVLTWDPIDNAKSFDIYFNGSTEPIDSNKVDNVNRYVPTNTVTVVMQAIANYWNNDHTLYYVSSNLSNTKQFTKIANVTFSSPSFTNTELIWNMPNNISANSSVSYKVFNSTGNLFREGINSTRLSLTELEAGNYTFTVQCIGDGVNLINSEKSVPVTITKLATPVVQRTSNGYTWQSVASASSYVVYVDGQIAYTRDHVPGETYEYKPNFDKIKNYEVKVYAVGDGGFNTIDSNPAEITQIVRQLDSPKFSIAYSLDHFDSAGQIVIDITQEPANATGYKYMVDGVVVEDGALTTAYFTTKTPGDKKVAVQAHGGQFDGSGVYYIDSLVIGGNNEYKITLLEKPNVNSVTISVDGVIRWSSVTNCKGYKVVVYYDNGNDPKVYEPVTPYIQDNDFAHITKIEIQATGNGTTVIASEVVTYTN